MLVNLRFHSVLGLQTSFQMDWWKKKKEKKKGALLSREREAMLLEDLIKCCDGKSTPIKFFSADLILKATDNFSNSNHEFRSFRCDWYSGVNDNSRTILIKKYRDRMLGNVDSYFCRDVAISSMVSGHKNFMKLVGCCPELEYPVLVYYGEKKKCSKIDLKRIVSLKRRMKIAEDIATALAYLHTAFSTPFVYRNMNICNILIDEDGVAKLTDFSCCISIPIGETFVKVDSLAGTLGYVDDDYMMNYIVSEKTDAYGFGRFMLMLIVDDRIDELSGEHWWNPKWVSQFIQEGRFVDDIADPKMLENMGGVTEEERCRMNAFLLLSLRCFGHKEEVPTMVQVAKELKMIQRYSQNTCSSF